jgi:Fuc2NAc and GlcNAc transferase
MTWFSILWCLIVIFILSSVLDYYLIAFAKKRNLLDIPNDRSSHTIPTARGGGISIALAVIFCLIWLSVREVDTPAFLIGLGVTVFLVALVAVIDDVRDLSSVIRAGLYLLIACVFILSVNEMLPVNLSGWGVILFSTLAITWATNLYNFMDGADGLAAIQTLIVTLPVGLIYYLSDQYEMALLSFAVAASTAGFLMWNWPPAKLFMGDVGSCMLGFLFGCLIYLNYIQDILSVYVWFILLSVFIVDATLTLFKRVFAGEKWYQAHCSHAYQRYLQMGNSHKDLAVKFLVLGLIVLWPLAFLAYQNPQLELWITLFVYAFLYLVWYFIQYSYNNI